MIYILKRLKSLANVTSQFEKEDAKMRAFIRADNAERAQLAPPPPVKRKASEELASNLMRTVAQYDLREAALLAEIDARRAELSDIRKASRAASAALEEFGIADMEQAADDALAEAVSEGITASIT